MEQTTSHEKTRTEQQPQYDNNDAEGLELPPEVWVLVASYLGPGWKDLARLSLTSHRLHAIVWGQLATLDLSGHSSRAAWWRALLARRRQHPLDHGGGERDARDPLEYILRFLQHRSPELRRLSLPGEFSAHHAPLLPSGLRHLTLNNVVDPEATVAAALARIPHLLSLHLKGMGVTEAMLATLPAKLMTLWVDTPSSYWGDTLTKLPPDLTELHLRSCQSHTFHFEKLPNNLRILDLSGSRNVTGQMLEHVPQGLQVLNLRDCRAVMLAELTPALSRLRNLRELDVRGCVVDDSVVAFLPASLRVLRVSGMLTDAAIPALPSRLEALTLFNMPNITGAGVSAYLELRSGGRGHKNDNEKAELRALTLAFCPKVGDDGLRPLGDLPALAQLKIKGGGRKCRITDAALWRLPSTLRRLHIESAPAIDVGSLCLAPCIRLKFRP